MPQSKEEKRLYDIEYRRKNKKLIAEKKQIYCETVAGRVCQKKSREKRKGNHLEYCRQPEYRKYKSKFDKVYLAKKKYGEFWECMLIVNEIHKKILKLVPDKYDRCKMRGQIERMKIRKAWKRHIEFGWDFNY